MPINHTTTAVAFNTTPHRLLTTPQAAEYLQLGKNTLEQDRLRGGGIPYVQRGRSVRYDIVDLDAWIAANKRRSTSELVGRADVE
jgi:excisionase family DNA binding protein